MAKVYIERAYIEAHDDNHDNFSIEVLVKSDGTEHLVGKVDLYTPKPWIYLDTNGDGDLIINNSQGMEHIKWDHITYEIIGSTLE
jgi:hypothetical protein